MDTPGLVDTRLAEMWRDVYRKAAEVAEQRSRELLRDHVYQYPHSAGGGAGALVLVQTQVMADATATRVHFTTIPSAGAGLLLVVTAHQLDAAGAGSLLLRLNDDATTNYISRWHELFGAPSGAPSHQGIGGDASYVPLGRLSIANADDSQDPHDASAGIVTFLPGHGITGRRKQVLSQGSAFTNISQHWFGQYGGEWKGTAAITKLSLIPSGTSATFGTGSRFTLYQLGIE